MQVCEHLDGLGCRIDEWRNEYDKNSWKSRGRPRKTWHDHMIPAMLEVRLTKQFVLGDVWMWMEQYTQFRNGSLEHATFNVDILINK